MYNVLQILQIVISILLVVLVLVQSKGGGFSSGVAKSFNFYRSRRGVEKIVFIVTIVSSLTLVVNSLLLTLLN